MTPALTPALALDYLRELSADVRGGAVLGASGARLAGDPALAGPAAAFVAAMGGAAEAETRTARGVVVAARSPEHAVVLVCGPRALSRLARHDLQLILGDLEPRAPAPAGPGPAAPASPPAALAEALISAAQRGPGA
jgi:hypothetical protein